MTKAKVLSMKTVNDSKVEISEISDGLENLIAELGTGQDKRSQGRFVNTKQLSLGGERSELDALYQTMWVAGKVVDIIPNDMSREWRSLDGEITPEQLRKFEEEETRLDVDGAFNFANKWARLYGTGYIVLSVDDGQTPDKPLNLNAIKKGGLQHIKVLDRHQLQHQGVINNNPLDANFGLPEFYTPIETSIRIHHSRVLRFEGVEIPHQKFRENNYNSNSVLDRLYDPMLDFNTATSASSSMIYETNVDIIKVDGFMQMLQSAEGEALLRKRITLANQLKSFNNALVMDTKEDHQMKSNTFAGLPDLIDRFSQILSAASDIPATRLLGNSASGLNATGEGDLKNYYDSVKSMQNKNYKPKLSYLDQIIAASLGFSEDVDLSFDFNSLFQLSDTEQADVDLKNAQRDDIYLNQSVVPVSVVAKDLKQNKVYTNIDDDYILELEKFENEEPDIDEGFEVNEPDDDKTLKDVFGVIN